MTENRETAECREAGGRLGEGEEPRLSISPSSPLSGSPSEPPRPPEPSLSRIKAYHRQKRNLHIAGIAITVGYWLAWLWAGEGFVAAVANAVDSRWVGLLVSVGAMLGGMVVVSLPLDYYSGYVLEQRYHLSNQTPRAWFVFQVKGWLIGAILGAIVIGGLYALLWYGGAMWSVWLWVGVMLLSVGLAKLFPLVILPLFYPSRPLERPSLTERLEQMAAGTGLTLKGVFDLQLSKETRKANAMLAGMGSTRRVYLSDTLLHAFTDDQIAVVFAHELGHHLRGHIWKNIALAAVMSSLLVALIHWRLVPHGGPAHPDGWAGAIAAFPQVMLIVALFPLLISPITNAISRHFERQCDSDALRLTNDPHAYKTAFQQLGTLNMADPDPPRWEEILFDDHPALSKRIAMADQYIAQGT
jgi:STE24 endopeptidase